MGKVGKDRKRRRLLAGIATKKDNQDTLNADILSENTNSPSYVGIVSEDDMATTLQTLLALERHPEVFRSKACKPLRAVVHQLQQAATATTGTGTTQSGRISDALTDGRWGDAMIALEEMRSRNKVPKLGALQRWVRDCDAASAKEGGTFGDVHVLRVLDSILRTADPSMVPSKAQNGEKERHPVIHHPMWVAAPRQGPKVEMYEAALAKTLFTEEEAERYRNSFKIVAHTKGPLRKTPNLHDFTLYHSKPGTIQLTYADQPEQQPAVERIDVPHVPGAFLLKDVLTLSECKQIISAAESVGFTPDMPIVGTASESISVLAHNFFWLADTPFLDHIFDRCKAHFPTSVGDGELAVGLNSRWRVYRYVPGAIYRIHLDGSWPASGLDPVTGAYLYDAYEGKRYSRLTFLIYLNDEFEGGGTTFFTPNAEPGFMDARAVAPRTGSILCFPHGDAVGSLLHEGSPVLRGAKYVIRADVLYNVPVRK
ncbi:hypothetical protein K7432_003107 [Basidiobolus ranarum]|uniref:Fe2OG dioxygenase domain-containing protein n=1 Tax=Basidiobolus ranarum TaxID=34480 RepID=A0ABR2W7P3_9FUNG